MEESKIGELVRRNLPQIIAYCEQVDPDEIVRLSDKQYSKEVFALPYAFWRTPAEAQQIKVESNNKDRYWAEVHRVLSHEVRVTNHWVDDKSRAAFLYYLEERGLTPVGITPAAVEAELDQLPAGPPSTSGTRYKVTAIGNPQNLAVRNVLARLGHESFTAKDWLKAKDSFQHSCVYCGSQRNPVMDHAVPISIEELGEHCLGNLVPACRDCNSDKGKKSYDVFLHEQCDHADAERRIAAIEDHMRRHNYSPLTRVLSPEDAARVRTALQALREEVAQAATATAVSINDLITK